MADRTRSAGPVDDDQRSWRKAMNRRTLKWAQRVGSLAGLVLVLGGGSAALGQEKSKPPTALPTQLVAAWKKAGVRVRVGWTRVRNDGLPAFLSLKEGGKAGDLPAFEFRTWQQGVLPKLPVPVVPFGLNLEFMPVTDAGLTDLAGLKCLQSLNLFGTQVTDAGLKELAALKSLKSLSL